MRFWFVGRIRPSLENICDASPNLIYSMFRFVFCRKITVVRSSPQSASTACANVSRRKSLRMTKNTFKPWRRIMLSCNVPWRPNKLWTLPHAMHWIMQLPTCPKCTSRNEWWRRWRVRLGILQNYEINTNKGGFTKATIKWRDYGVSGVDL